MNELGTCPCKEPCRSLQAELGVQEWGHKMRNHLCIYNLTLWRASNGMLSKWTFLQTERRLNLQFKTPDFSTRQYFPGDDQQLYCGERQRKHLDMRQSLWCSVLSPPFNFCLRKWALAHSSYLWMASIIHICPTFALKQMCHHLVQQKKDPTLISRTLNFFFTQVIFAGTFKCQADTF